MIVDEGSADDRAEIVACHQLCAVAVGQQINDNVLGQQCVSDVCTDTVLLTAAARRLHRGLKHPICAKISVTLILPQIQLSLN